MFQMTGLDVQKERLIEIACLVTNAQLDIIAEVKYFTLCEEA